jgi:hypothetical protein
VRLFSVRSFRSTNRPHLSALASATEKLIRAI